MISGFYILKLFMEKMAMNKRIGYWTGKKRPDMSKLMKEKGIVPPSQKGIIKSLEHRRKLSEAHKGEKNWRWNGGKHLGAVNKQAKIRDDYTCQICGLRDIEIMEADHIKQRADFPELSFCLENVITLCPNCHRRRTNNYLKNRNKKHD